MLQSHERVLYVKLCSTAGEVEGKQHKGEMKLTGRPVV